MYFVLLGKYIIHKLNQMYVSYFIIYLSDNSGSVHTNCLDFLTSVLIPLYHHSIVFIVRCGAKETEKLITTSSKAIVLLQADLLEVKHTFGHRMNISMKDKYGTD